MTGAASAVDGILCDGERHRQPEGRLGEGVVRIRDDDGLRPDHREPAERAGQHARSPFSAQLSGLPAGTTIHYRAVASSDFGTFVGADRTFTTAPAPPTPPATGSTGTGTGAVTAAVGRATVLARATHRARTPR